MAVELRLGKIGRSLAKNIVTAAKLTNFLFQLFEALALIRRQPGITYAVIALMLTEPGPEGIRAAANFGGDGVDGCIFRAIFTALFLQHSYGTFT